MTERDSEIIWKVMDELLQAIYEEEEQHMVVLKRCRERQRHLSYILEAVVPKPQR